MGAKRGNRKRKHMLGDAITILVAIVAAALVAAQCAPLVAAVKWMFAGEREATNEAPGQLEANREKRMEKRMEHHVTEAAMSTRRATMLASSWSPPTAHQPRPLEGVEAQDVASAVVCPSSSSGGRATSEKHRPGAGASQLHRAETTAVNEPGAATGAEMRTGVLQGSDSGSVQPTDPGSPPLLKRRSASDRLPLTQQAAGPGLAKDPAAPGIRRGATGKSKAIMPLSSGARFYARVLERTDEANPARLFRQVGTA